MPSTSAEAQHVAQAPTPTAPRRLIVVRQDPDSRAFQPLGHLVAEIDGTYTFSYNEREVAAPDFRPVPGFPDTSMEYRSPRLFPFFTSRVMSPRRADYPAHLQAVGLAGEAPTPVEMLIRTAGRRATDTYQVIPEPTVDAQGVERRLFLVSGIRHVQGGEDRIADLETGQPLILRPDPDNTFDCDAVLLDVRSREPVGFVPGYMCDYVHEHRTAGASIDVTVVQANGPEIPRHLRLLCEMAVTPTTIAH